MKCLKCGSEDTYRKGKYDLIVICDRCSYKWETNQVAFPFLRFQLYKKEGLKGKHYIDAWLCPTDKTKFSFSLRYGSSLPYQFPNPEYSDPCLKGKFDTPQEAINAGIEEIYNS